jgi:hypothetical protein
VCVCVTERETEKRERERERGRERRRISIHSYAGWNFLYRPDLSRSHDPLTFTAQELGFTGMLHRAHFHHSDLSEHEVESYIYIGFDIMFP